MECVSLLTFDACFWFGDFGIDKINRHFCLTFQALEHGCFHFWEDLATPDYDSSERDEPVNMLVIETSH